MISSFVCVFLQAFCRFDDYNWDWSLQHISVSCLPERLRVMLLKAPRIYHIGEWSVGDNTAVHVNLDTYTVCKCFNVSVACTTKARTVILEVASLKSRRSSQTTKRICFPLSSRWPATHARPTRCPNPTAAGATGVTMSCASVSQNPISTSIHQHCSLRAASVLHRSTLRSYCLQQQFVHCELFSTEGAS